MRIRTGYSFKHAVGHVPEVLSRIKEIEWDTAPVCDRLSTFSFVRWTRECREHGLRPVYGCELPVVDELGRKKPIVDYWAFFARRDLRHLNEAVRLATMNEGLTYQQAARLCSRDLVGITGNRCLLDRIERWPRHLFFGLSPSVPVGLYRAAVGRSLPMILSSDNVYTRREDEEFYRITLGWRSSTQTYPQHVLDEEELRAATWYASGAHFSQALKNRNAAMRDCRAEMRKATLLSPESKKTLRQLCLEGAKRLSCDLRRPVYRERLDRELDLISAKKFEDYFFIVADLMRWARERMVVGPARGSSCGSLVCWLLGITAIDPIPHDLIFERFVDITRSDLPDIDLDFSDVRRELAIDYLSKKYGAERAARLGSVGMFQAKSIMKTIGASLRIPQWQVTEVGNTIIRRTYGDSRASSTVEDTFTGTEPGRRLLRDFPAAMVAARMEEHPYAAGQHAAGVVLTEEPVINYVAVDSRTGGTMCDKYDAEDLNLMKIDMLGLTQLSVFERCLELIGERPTSDFLEALPLDDPKAFAVLNDLRLSGIFQFVPGSALAGLVKRIVREDGGAIDKLDDLVALTALVRPGPLGSGMTDSWIKRRAGQERVSYEHPLLEPFLRDTLGLVIYQEQIMKIGKELGDLSWEQTIAIRRAMGRTLGKEFFDQYGDPWKEGAVRKGLPRQIAVEFWDKMCQFGMFSFNKSHSVAYGTLSYWCCWLKAHHPLEYAAATLDAETDQMKMVTALRELRSEGVDYVPFDPRMSTDRWTIRTIRADAHGSEPRRVLVGPLTNVRGVGDRTVRDIMDARARGEAIRPSIAKRLEHATTTLDTLSPIADAVARTCPDLPGVGVRTLPTPISDVELNRRGVLIIGRVSRVAPLNENEPSRVARRGGRRVTGPERSVNLHFEDDTGEIFCKISRYNFPAFGEQVVSQAKRGKSLFAVKGWVPPDFRMIWIDQIKYLGEMT